MAFKVRNIISVLLLLGIAQAFLWEECPKSIRHRTYLRVRGSYCYYFVTFTSKLPYNMAERACEKYGGTLVKVFSEDLNFYLQMTLTFDFKATDENVWIGLSDRLYENVLLWEDRTRPSYTNFESSHRGTRHGCIAMRTGNGKWRAMKCRSYIGFLGDSNHFVCQYKITPTTPTPKTTPTTRITTTTPTPTTIASTTPTLTTTPTTIRDTTTASTITTSTTTPPAATAATTITTMQTPATTTSATSSAPETTTTDTTTSITMPTPATKAVNQTSTTTPPLLTTATTITTTQTSETTTSATSSAPETTTDSYIHITPLPPVIVTILPEEDRK